MKMKARRNAEMNFIKFNFFKTKIEMKTKYNRNKLFKIVIHLLKQQTCTNVQNIIIKIMMGELCAPRKL